MSSKAATSLLPKSLPKNYDPALYEAEWQRLWEEWGIYSFDRHDTARPTYSIDTPPPYPSGEFHMGNALNWCYFDFVARYKRMRGFNVHFPQGWDCHGLPTEVRVESTFKVRKRDLPADKFKELCVRLTAEYIEKMKKAMRMMGYSIDWSLEYRTMDPSYYRLTQLSFVQLHKAGKLYRGEHPVNWCPRCETAIAEAEVEYVESKGTLHYLRFNVEGKPLVIATTRPELIHACVAVAVNPDDERYGSIVGKTAEVPFSKSKVPILSDEAVDTKFGTGAVMICTFGDKTDVKWQKKYGLPVVKAITEDGRMTGETGSYAGMMLDQCKQSIVSDLNKFGLIEKFEQVNRNIGTCWRCHTPVEIIARPQWFMKTREMTEQAVDWSNRIRWIPEFAKSRMIDWANSLDWDWVISRQRVFATPIPAWYCKKCGETIVAAEEAVPIDPRFDRSPVEKCPKCASKEFAGENDVMDTWMDSSITCAVHAGWPDDPALFKRLFPADLQPNGLDIIRTWDYYLMVKHLALFGVAPYKTVLVNGMVRGADGRMMHKSFGNYVETTQAVGKYGADSVRQWAAAGGVTGADIPFRWSEIEHGRKFLTKLWNATRLIIDNLTDYRPGEHCELELVDRWLASKLERLTLEVTESFQKFQFSIALEATRIFTWHVFCDQYLEAVKHRLYSNEPADAPSRKAAQYALYRSLLRIIQLLSPICPHITESIYQVLHKGRPPFRSLHVCPWPEPEKGLMDEEAERSGDSLMAVISCVRRIKSEKHLSQKAELKKLTVFAEPSVKETLRKNADMLSRTTRAELVEVLELSQAKEAVSYPEFPQLKLSVTF